MQASAAGAQARVAPAWAAVPIFAVAFMKSGPSLLAEPYRKHEHSKMGDRTAGQRDGMKRENYLPINILRTENLPPQSSFRKGALRGAP
jgi:hypothetical protein